MKIWARVFGGERVYFKGYFKFSSVGLHRRNSFKFCIF